MGGARSTRQRRSQHALVGVIGPPGQLAGCPTERLRARLVQRLISAGLASTDDATHISLCKRDGTVVRRVRPPGRTAVQPDIVRTDCHTALFSFRQGSGSRVTSQGGSRWPLEVYSAGSCSESAVTSPLRERRNAGTSRGSVRPRGIRLIRSNVTSSGS